MTRKFLFLVGIVYFSLFGVASANITINEVMYDLEGTDTDREWIEVYNSGSEAVDFSTYKLFEADTNHGLTVVQGDKNISSGGYAVIVQNKEKFKIDWPSFSGTIFDSSFSLNNDGEILAIKDADLNIVDSYTYSGATGGAGNGKSLQKIGNNWVEGEASAGLQNTGASNNQNSNTNTNTTENSSTNTATNSSGGGSGSATSNSTPKKTEITKIKAKIMTQNLAFAQIPTNFNLIFTGYSGEALHYGKYFINFGDGDFSEGNVLGLGSFSHTYFYEGEYTVTLEYYQNYYSQIPDATDKISIKVVPATVAISAVGTSADFFIELTNTTDYDVDVSKWVLLSSTKNFTLPKGTAILSKKKMMLSPRITNFVFGDEKNLKLFNSAGDLVFDFGATLVTPPISQKIISKNSQIAQNPAKQNFVPEISPTKSTDFDNSNTENLSANAISSNVTESINNKSYFTIFGLVILVGVGATLVYFIRKKRDVVNSGDDYDIA